MFECLIIVLSISPLDLDLYCNNGTETALHHVVRTREQVIAHRLLAAGCQPNLIIYTTEESPTSSTPSTLSSPDDPLGNLALISHESIYH